MEKLHTITTENMLQMLEDLVNIDSGSYDKEGVDQVGAYLRERYEAIGFKVTVHQNKERGDNLVLSHQESDRPNILVLAHMDTVFPKGTAANRPFTVKGDYAYGPGVIDMKASHVMLYFAICELIRTENDSYKNIEIVLNSDEEIGTGSSRAIIEQQAKDKDCVLVLEPARADGSIVSARRGTGTYELEVHGKAAHSGIEPEKGRSAIEALAYKIPELHALSDPEKNLNVNVGMIEGGSSVNTVASLAKAYIDVRISTFEQGDWIDKKTKEICSTTKIEGTELSLSGGINRAPMIFTDDIKTLVHLIQDEAGKLGIDVNHVATGGGSDASFTAAMNIPTVDGLGPVGGKQHSTDEYLEVKSLTERTWLFVKVLSRLHADRTNKKRHKK
jgi:glutamate carboxypeptidase